MIAAHLTEPPPRPSAVVADLPHRIDEVIARAMAKDPQRRYPSDTHVQFWDLTCAACGSGCSVRAMIFGAAWKVLDLLVELSLNRGPAPRNRYRIELKTQQASAGNVSPLPPFGTIPDVWDRVMTSYVATTALRHSLVHRRLEVDQTTGTMTATADAKDPPVSPMTADEQVAFCRIADGVAQAVITGHLAPRQENSVRWLLDQLAAHHGKHLFGASSKDGLIPEVIIRPTVGATNDVTIDFASVRQRALHTVGGVAYYDLQIHLPNGWVLAAPWRMPLAGS
ncbi:hypothetical protein ACIGO9_20705 [Nocardia asteroides]|uniref:hypothetical protein n=1 Tax=Nocardia asteroides TaxID=1824 RepID=UPI0037C5D374